MILHYIKFAIRSLFRDKVFSLINILGLTIGLTGTFIVSIYLINELSFDQHHKKKNQIYRINSELVIYDYHFTHSSWIVADAFKEEFPDIDKSVKTRIKSAKVKKGVEQISEKILFTTNTFFDIFDYPIILGDKINPLKGLNDVVISESLAIKLFDSINIIGKTFEISYRPQVKKNLRVSAIMKDVPWNSNMRGSLIGNFDLSIDSTKHKKVAWFDYETTVYVLLKENTNVTELQEKIDNYSSIQIPEDVEIKYNLQSMEDFHLNSAHLMGNFDKKGSKEQLNLFVTVGIILLLIASSNFIILSTAKAINRKREISLRKILGASRGTIIKQVSLESLLFCLIIIPIGFVLASYILPYASIIIGSKVEIHSSNLVEYSLLILIIFLLLILSSSVYIAFYTSKFKPLDAFRINHSKSVFWGRKFIITLQIFIFTSLVICTLTATKQIQYSKTKDLGFITENLYSITFPTSSYQQLQEFSTVIKTNPKIYSSAYAAQETLSNSFGRSTILIDNDPNQEIPIEYLHIDFEFIEAMGFEILSGRSFEKESSDTPSNVCIVNESLIKKHNIENPIGRTLNSVKIIGIIKDFHLHSTRYEVEPLMISLNEDYLGYMYLRIKDENLEEVKAFINKKWNEFYPNNTISFRSFATATDRAYKDDSEFARDLSIFAGLAIFLSIMGLYGLSLFTIEKRSKEIAIHKINGASINNIMLMINKEFAYLVIIGFILASPTAWYFMDKWLQNFAYTISFPYEIYLFSPLITFVIVLGTVSIRSLKVAQNNPIDALRTE